MMLSDHDALIIGSALKKCAIDYDTSAKYFRGRDPKKAAQCAHFSAECARIAKEFDKVMPAARLADPGLILPPKNPADG